MPLPRIQRNLNQGFSRKSLSIRLLLLAGAATLGVGGLVYVMSEDRPEDVRTQSFLNENACSVQTGNSALCHTAFETAVGDHLAHAPRFSDLIECEAQFGVGNCTTADAVGAHAETPKGAQQSVFLPLMSGFFLSQILGASPRYLYGSVYHDASGKTRCTDDMCQRQYYTGGHSGGGGHGGWFGRGGGHSVTGISRGGFGGAFGAHGG